ncbi:MAG: hypothetical protein Q9166_000085 [cf. Caloplaca sp. 2 TL-2023]
MSSITPFLIFILTVTLTTNVLSKPFNLTSHLALPPSHTLQSEGPILCYTPAYGTIHPLHRACAHILHDVLPSPDNEDPITFTSVRRSRSPKFYPVPVEWSSWTCFITISLPGPGQGWDIASWKEVKTAVTDVLSKCVEGEDRLGGMAKVGKRWGLMVEIRGDAPKKGRKGLERRVGRKGLERRSEAEVGLE